MDLSPLLCLKHPRIPKPSCSQQPYTQTQSSCSTKGTCCTCCPVADFNIITPLWSVSCSPYDTNYQLAFQCYGSSAPLNRTVTSPAPTVPVVHADPPPSCARYPTGSSVFWNLMTWLPLVGGGVILGLGVYYCLKIKRDMTREREQSLHDALLQKQQVGIDPPPVPSACVRACVCVCVCVCVSVQA